MNRIFKNNKVKYFTIEEIEVDWELTENNEKNFNNYYSKLGEGKGYFYSNGKIYINSKLYGNKDQFIQLVYKNIKNFSLENIFSDFYPTFSTYSGMIYECFGLVVKSLKVKPLSKKEYDKIHYSYVRYSN